MAVPASGARPEVNTVIITAGRWLDFVGRMTFVFSSHPVQGKGEAQRGSASLTLTRLSPGTWLGGTGSASAEHCLLLCAGRDRLCPPCALSPASPKAAAPSRPLASPPLCCGQGLPRPPALTSLASPLAESLRADFLSQRFFPLACLLGILPWASASSFPWRPPHAPSAPRSSPGPGGSRVSRECI